MLCTVTPSHLPAEQGGKKVKIVLNSNDKLYQDLRDLNFSAVGPALNRKAKQLNDFSKG